MTSKVVLYFFCRWVCIVFSAILGRTFRMLIRLWSCGNMGFLFGLGNVIIGLFLGLAKYFSFRMAWRRLRIYFWVLGRIFSIYRLVMLSCLKVWCVVFDCLISAGSSFVWISCCSLLPVCESSWGMEKFVNVSFSMYAMALTFSLSVNAMPPLLPCIGWVVLDWLFVSGWFSKLYVPLGPLSWWVLAFCPPFICVYLILLLNFFFSGWALCLAGRNLVFLTVSSALFYSLFSCLISLESWGSVLLATIVLVILRIAVCIFIVLVFVSSCIFFCVLSYGGYLLMLLNWLLNCV